MRKDEYLDMVQEQIRCRQARDGIRRELEGHIEEQAGYYRSRGIAAREAEEMAVRDMGDPVETGNALDSIHRPKMAWKSIGVIIGIGLTVFILQYIIGLSAADHIKSAGTWIPEGSVYWDSWIPGGAPRYLLIQMAGWGVMIGVCYLDYTRIGKYAVQLMLLGCIGIKILEILFAAPVNGADYWFFAGVSISARQLVFLFLPLYGAVLYRYRGQGYQGVAAGVLWILPSFMILLKNGMTAGFIVGITYLIMLTAAVWKDWFVVAKKKTIAFLWISVLLLGCLGINYIGYRGAPYQAARLQALMHGTEEAPFTMLARRLISGSRLLGTKAGFMNDSDGIMNIGEYTLGLICAYYGVLAAAALAVSILLLFLYFIRMSLRQKNQLGMIMGTGCGVVFLVELLLYIMGNMGLFPTVSYCPFLAYGGTGIMINHLLMGILLSVYRYENTASEVRVRKPEYIRQEEM